ncbi:HlyD family secretion protein [Hyphomicrobium sp.]|uniref:HlyD family secretion protein n=1 Tax=Hyphomicrobium sp. TaxID=82 RepID=UPI002E378BBB|nr:efflux RND transporter periplasmic adaptor subunit [Hyphomicrobium sp.]HEX2842885.1 efflux RND transporter periplasmic adaptor subunit [Hyphomicrobium sp.]
MIVFLFNIYLLILFLLVHFKVISFNLFWKLSPVLVFVLLNIGLFIPMGWGAPSGPLLLTRHSVQIVPDVAGEVIDVPIQPNVAIKANDVLFRIDPAPFKAQVDALDAQLKFAELRREQFTTLQRGDAGRAFDVQQRESEVQQLKAQLDGARWNLDKTTVRAPTDGYVTNLALRKGARVANFPLSPVMAFIDTSESIVSAEIAQNHARYIEPGQSVEVTFKMFPGHIYKGRVESVLQAISTGQVKPSGFAVTPPSEVVSAPFIVRIALDDADVAKRLPAGSTGAAAIFTEHVKVTHVIRKVMLRMQAIFNYINPF